LAGHPLHSTVRISLWGLQFEFPEHHLTDDVLESLEMTVSAEDRLNDFQSRTPYYLLHHRSEIASLVRKRNFGAPGTVLACFNLTEAYFNSLAWEFLQKPGAVSSLSDSNRKLMEDTTRVPLSQKVLKYPEIIMGKPMFNRDAEPFRSFFDIVKPFRDSLVHASPFSAPQKFGGYDKLRNLYRIATDTAVLATVRTCDLICQMHNTLHAGQEPHPFWLSPLVDKINALDSRQQNEDGHPTAMSITL
jgi:hypothetical protein